MKLQRSVFAPTTAVVEARMAKILRTTAHVWAVAIGAAARSAPLSAPGVGLVHRPALPQR